MFAPAKRIGDYLFAALFLARSSAGLADKPSTSSAVADRMNKLDAYLSFCEDLMVDGTISSASLGIANQLNAQVNLTIRQPDTLSPAGALLSADGIGMILTTSTLPFTTVIMNAPNGNSYELGDLSVTIRGQAAQMLSVSPTSITFKVPANLTGGLAGIVVTSRQGYISYNTANVSGLNPTILVNGDSSGGGAILDSLNVYSGSFSTITPAQYLGLDTQTAGDPGRQDHQRSREHRYQ